jgi:predicted ATPase
MQVDRIVPYAAMTRDDLVQLFDQLLSSANKLRSQHKRATLDWDHTVLTHLADSEQMGGYSAGLARQGGSHAVEVFEQLLDQVDQHICAATDVVHLTCDSSGQQSRIKVSCGVVSHAREDL